MNRLTRSFCFLDEVTTKYERVVYTKSNFLVIQPKQGSSVRYSIPPEHIKRTSSLGRLLAANKNDPPSGYDTWDDFIDSLIQRLNATRSQRKQNKPKGKRQRLAVLR